MSVVECDVPRHSALGKELIDRADFRDAFRAPLSRSDLSVVEIFFAIFARRAQLDESDANCTQQGSSSSWPGGADYLGKRSTPTSSAAANRSFVAPISAPRASIIGRLSVPS